MKTNSNAWSGFYEKDNNYKPMIPESFIARVFLSKKPVQLLQDYNFSNKKILDIGSGEGRHSKFFLELGFDVEGCEVSDDKVAELNEKFPDASFYTSVSNEIKQDDEYYDYIVGANSIYYLEDETSSIKHNISEISRVLKKDGCLVISFVGDKHFILDKSEKLDDNSALIKNDPLVFRNETRIRPVWDREDLVSVLAEHKELDIHKIGEITDECDGIFRHLYYCVLYKNR